jgi:AmiR/NasT family two-component response regulator
MRGRSYADTMKTVSKISKVLMSGLTDDEIMHVVETAAAESSEEPAISDLAALAGEHIQLRSQAKNALEELETRKRVERAKGILMKKEKLTEEEAYLRLRKYSMDRRKTMREVAEAIIMVDDLKTDAQI